MAAAKQNTAPKAREALPLSTRSGRPSLIVRFAAKYGIDHDKMLETLKSTAFRQRGKNGGPPPEITNEQMVALLIVAERYDLDPFVKQIYAFPNKSGGIEPIVPIDGWLKIINNHPQFDEMEVEFPPPEESEKRYAWVKCSIWKKGKKKPTVKIEWFDECYRNTDPWNEMPRRMLEWKAIIQCGRKAFNLSGIFDPDEAERIANAMAIEGTAERLPSKQATQAPQSTGTLALTNDEQLKLVRDALDSAGIPENELCEKLDLGQLTDLKFEQLQPALDWIKSVNAPAR